MEEKNYKELYSKKFKDFEQVFENAGVMNSAVELADRIKINSATSPLDFLISLSEVISKDTDQSLHIDKIEWQAVNINEKNSELETANFTGKLSVKHSAVITGRIDDPDNNYRASVNHIQKIINYLKTDPKIEEVTTLTLPVDLRSESQFSSESGINVKKGKDAVSGLFSLKVIMKEPGNV